MKEMNKLVSSFADISIDMQMNNGIEAIKKTAEYKMECDLEKTEGQKEIKAYSLTVQNDLEELLCSVGNSQPCCDNNTDPTIQKSNSSFARQKRRSWSSSQRKKNNKSKHFGLCNITEKKYDNLHTCYKESQELKHSMEGYRNPLKSEVSDCKSPARSLPPILNLHKYRVSTMSWLDIEKENLRFLLSTNLKKIFRVDVTQEQIEWSLQNKGFFPLTHNVYYQILHHCAKTSVKYFLLQEHVPASLQVNLLVGIAQVCEPIPILSDSSRKAIYVKYLCLSRSGINLRVFNSNGRESVDTLLKTYLQTIEDKLVEPFVPDVFPYSEVQTSSNSSVYPDVNVVLDQNTNSAPNLTDVQDTQSNILTRLQSKNENQQTFDLRETVVCLSENAGLNRHAQVEHSNSAIKHHNYAVYWYENLLGGNSSKQNKETTHVKNNVSPSFNVSRKECSTPLQNIHSNAVDWMCIEHDNLEEISDTATSKFFVCDVTRESITKSVHNNGRLRIDPFISGMFENSTGVASLYLVLRLTERNSATKKAVVGIAKLLSTCDIESSGLVRVEYLCLSRPNCVGSPWCEEENFTNGQEFVHGEERILLNEYKLSLRRKKVKALLTNIYPWSGGCITPSFTQKTHQQRHASEQIHIDERMTSADELENNQSFTIKSQSRVLKTVEPLDSLVKRSVCHLDKQQSKNKDEVNNRRTEKQAPTQQSRSQQRLILNSTEPSGPHVSSHAKRTQNVIPPMKDLYVTGKTLTQNCWEVIEYKNLSCLLNSPTAHEYFLCETTVSAVRRSFRTTELEISARNMQNVASAGGRTRKFLILRTFFRNQKRNAIVGVANVNASVDVRMDPKKKDCFLVNVCYYCLSVPIIKVGNLTSCDWRDGMEIGTSFLTPIFHQYMLALQQKNVHPLFKDIFPWSFVPPKRFLNSSESDRMSGTNSSVSMISEASNDVCDNSRHPTLHVESKVYEALADNDLMTYLDSGNDSGLSFAQIDQELSRCHDTFHPNTDTELYQPLKFQYQTSMAIEANKFKQYARNAAHELIFSPPKKKNYSRPVPTLKPGRGRGTLLMKHIGILP